MLLQRLVVPPLAANCYLFGCQATRQAALIDPGGDADAILRAVRDQSLTIRAVLQTHGHLDHMTAAHAVSQSTDAPIYAHPAEHAALRQPDATFAAMLGIEVQPVQHLQSLQDGDELALGQLSLRVIATPGHTPGAVCFLVEENLFTGDTLFAGGVGRTDLPGGDYRQLLRSLRQSILPLPDHLAVHPGHGPPTALGEEKKHNPWLLEARAQNT